MSPDDAQERMPTPLLRPACPGGPVLVYALSGLGKTTLSTAHPDEVYDADLFIHAAVEQAFPALDERGSVRAWRELCRRRPWESGGTELQLWADTRRAMMAPVVDLMESGDVRLVVTSLLRPPWLVSAYFGVERGHYLEHLRMVSRKVDNHQSEAMNDRLEGFAPLVRIRAGGYLADEAVIRGVLRAK